MTKFIRMWKATLLAGGLILSVGPVRAAPGTPAEPVFSLADLSTTTKLSTPALSADGRRLAVVVSRPDPVEDRVSTSIVVVDTRSGAQLLAILLPGEGSDLAWSPNGRTLAWLAPDGAKITQIMSIEPAAHGAAPTVVTSAVQSITGFAWSPDGQSLAFLAEPATPTAKDDARFDKTFEIADADYLGTTYLARTRGSAAAQLWVVPATGGTARMLTSQSDHIVDLAWQRDGRSIVINTRPGVSEVSGRFGALSSIAVADGTRTVLLPSPANAATEARMRVSRGGTLAFQHYRGLDPWTHGNDVATIVGGTARDATAKLDRDVTDFEWLGNEESLLVVAHDHLRSAFWTVPPSGAPLRRLDLGDANPLWQAATSSSGAIAFVGTGSRQPAEVYFMASARAKPVRLTHFNDALLDRGLGRSEAVTWKTDAFTNEGVLTFPPDYRPDRKYPMLVNIHGGPHTSAQLSYNGEAQFYAANGWLVFEPNYRGSDGQGDRYQSAVIGDATPGPGRDIRAGMDAIRRLANVDDRRIAVTGWSYGGVMTMWLIGQHHDWCAAIPGVLVTDFADYYDQSETGIWMKVILGSPHLKANQEKYRLQSPRTYLDQVTTPTLAMQNVGDPNAPVGQAYTVQRALTDNGAKVKLVVFGIDGHGPGDPFHEREAFRRTLGWMNENCASAGVK